MDTAILSSTEDVSLIFDGILNEIKSGIDSENVCLIQKNLFLLNETFSPIASSCKELVVSQKDLFKKAENLVKIWLKQLKLFDEIEVYHELEKKWFPAKIIDFFYEDGTSVLGLPEINPKKSGGNFNMRKLPIQDYPTFPNSLMRLHWLGWDMKYDVIVNRYEININPANTLLAIRKAVSKPQFDEAQETILKVESLNTQLPSSDPVIAEKTSDLTECQAEGVVLTKSGRAVRKAAASFLETTSNNASSKKGRKAKVEETENAEDHNDWTCAVCFMFESAIDSTLVLCDGPCRRSFHDICMHSSELKKFQESKTWLCSQCRDCEHQCHGCKKIGKDNLDVFKCNQLYCGKYFHYNCLTAVDLPYLRSSIHNVERCLSGEEAKLWISRNNFLNRKSLYSQLESDGFVSVPLPKFDCSYHRCDTCSEHYGLGYLAKEIIPCLYCPRAFHANCVPPGSRFNTMVLVCPLHPDMALPGLSVPKSRPEQLDWSPTTNNKRSKKSNVPETQINSYSSVFEQFGCTDGVSSEDIITSNYRLHVSIKNHVETMPQNFKMISRNNHDKFPAWKDHPLKVPDFGCDCKVICDDKCFNRGSYVECCETKTAGRDGLLCSAGKYCGNRALQNKEYIKTKVFKEGDMGNGLKALEFAAAGKLVIEYIGEVIDEAEMRRRLESQRVLSPNDKEYYIMQLDDGVYIDGKFEGNVSRFINHSCDPNCELQRWNVRGRMRIAIVAIRDIAPDEPLSYDYRFDTSQEDVFKCYCGSANCRGTMAPKSAREKLESRLMDKQNGRELRKKMMKAAMEKERKSLHTLVAEEKARSYTGRFLPGERISEIRNGPVKSSFKAAKVSKLFLLKHVRNPMDFSRRVARLKNSTRESRMFERFEKTQKKQMQRMMRQQGITNSSEDYF